jgi:hypothetical protein
VVHVDLGARLQEFALEMGKGADPGRGVVQRTRPRLRHADQFGYRSGGNRRMHGEDFTAVRDTSDRCECSRVVTGVLVDRRRDEKRARASHHYRVAVRLRGCDRSGSDRAAGSGTVLHDHRLPETSRHLLRQEPRHDIRRSARGRRDDQLDRPIRERLRALKRQQMRDKHDESGDHFLLHTASPEGHADPGDQEPMPMSRRALYDSVAAKSPWQIGCQRWSV